MMVTGSWLISFVGIGKIPYKKDAGPEEVLVFRHYNANEVLFDVFTLFVRR